MLNGGVASLTLDGKGRLMVPARLRADMSDATLVVTLESAKCLLLYRCRAGSRWKPENAFGLCGTAFGSSDGHEKTRAGRSQPGGLG